MTIRHSSLFLIGLMMLTIPVEKLSATYTCTFKNDTASATIKVRFIRKNLLKGITYSPPFTVLPGNKQTWEAKIGIKGIVIDEIKYSPEGDTSTIGGIKVPEEDLKKLKQVFKTRKLKNITWKMNEKTEPISRKQKRISFELNQQSSGMFTRGKTVGETEKVDINQQSTGASIIINS